MRPMPINWISTYLYCKRKLYLEQAMEIGSSDEKYPLKLDLKYRIFDEINSVDEEIVKSIKSFKKLDEIQMIFRRKYYEIANVIIEEGEESLSKINYSVANFFHEIWPFILKEVNFRADNLFNFMIRRKIYSDELWKELFPKYLSEVRLENNMLKGVVDRIEIYPEHIVPVELKNSKGPNEGVWPGDRLQVEGYMILAEGNFGKKVKHGFVNYLGSGEKRLIKNNEFVEDYLSTILDSIDKCLKGKLPNLVKNRNKCTKCPLKGECYKIKK